MPEKSNAPVTTKSPAKQQRKLKEEPQVGFTELPIGGPPARGYVPSSVPESRLTARQGLALKALLSSCVKSQAHCQMDRYDAEGKPVTRYGHCIRYLLDKYADAWEQEHDVELLDLPDMISN